MSNPKEENYTQTMSDKMKNFIVRTISGVVMFAILLFATLYSQWSFTALVALIMVGGLWEFYALSEKCGAEPQRIFGMTMAAAILLAGIALVTPDVEMHQGIVWMKVFSQYYLLLALPLMLICELFRQRENPIMNIGATLLGVVYVALPMAMLLFVPISMGGWQPWMVLFFIFTIWANDVFAYLVGVTMGKHKMCPTISPKKSWEGFFGGLVGALCMGVAAAKILEMDIKMWCGLALVAAVSGVLGDLLESMFKRKAGVKDSGNVIPGHGGVLDRFDALILATPFVCVYLLVWLFFRLSSQGVI